MPPSLQLRQYQRVAVANWFANQGRGTLKMATGSGKTITALAIATELYNKINLQVLLVICPYCHLVNQWARESEKFGLKPILAFDSAAVGKTSWLRVCMKCERAIQHFSQSSPLTPH